MQFTLYTRLCVPEHAVLLCDERLRAGAERCRSRRAGWERLIHGPSTGASESIEGCVVCRGEQRVSDQRMRWPPILHHGGLSASGCRRRGLSVSASPCSRTGEWPTRRGSARPSHGSCIDADGWSSRKRRRRKADLQLAACCPWVCPALPCTLHDAARQGPGQTVRGCQQAAWMMRLVEGGKAMAMAMARAMAG